MTDTAYRWHVGNNVSGYSPEDAPACCKSANEARDVLVEELQRSRDALIDPCALDDGGDGCEPCALYAAASDVIVTASEADVSLGYSANVDIGRSLPITHWVERFDVTEFDNHAECNPDY